MPVEGEKQVTIWDAAVNTSDWIGDVLGGWMKAGQKVVGGVGDAASGLGSGAAAVGAGAGTTLAVGGLTAGLGTLIVVGVLGGGLVYVATTKEGQKAIKNVLSAFGG